MFNVGGPLMTTETRRNCFHVYRTGQVTVIGFNGRDLEQAEFSEEIHDGLIQLVQSHQCEVLVVDLTNVSVVSSWLLGILVALREHGTVVELYHPSPDIREMLSTAHLDKRLHVRDTI